jgi:hypothetical protein
VSDIIQERLVIVFSGEECLSWSQFNSSTHSSPMGIYVS